VIGRCASYFFHQNGQTDPLIKILRMQLQAYFGNIQQVIIDHLHDAQHEILVAVAWFTDREIFEVLCQKAQKGVHISVALLGDQINKAPGALNFERLRNIGGKVTFLPSGSDGAPMMHHKFCVLDGTTVITGSYNWSKKAQSNDENITVVSDAREFSTQYRQAFLGLVAGLTPQGTASSTLVNTDAVRRRLEMMRNLILLGEQDDLPPHIQKLRPIVEQLRLQTLLQALEQSNYKNALQDIETYLQRSSALVLREDIDVPNLQFQLQVLELRQQSLSDEKSDWERTLVIFNRRYNDALGTLLIDLLGAQAKLARQKAEARRQQTVKDVQAEQEAEQAEQDWQGYRQEYEEQQTQHAPSRLSEEDEQELKNLYRKACSLCHPDRFEDDQKEAAHQAFVVLQEVYKTNDLSALREFHTTLKTSGLPNAPRSITLSRSDSLRAAIAELQHRINETLRQLQHLHRSEGADLLRLAGNTEADWLGFFEKQKQLLQEEILQLQHAITLYNTADAD
jgi:hypothetical protein